jgi:uncharacterized membrane-anchored protein
VGGLEAGDIACIHHRDIDRVSAEELVASGVRCVINGAPSSSGRYPNHGPLILTEAGVHLLDVDDDVFDKLSDGERLTVVGAQVFREGRLVLEGSICDYSSALRAYEKASQTVGQALEAFAENTMSRIREERDLLAGRLELPDFDTRFRDRPVLVVVRGVDYRKDLRILRAYVRDTKPVLVGVDGGAEAILEEGFVPDVIVGDMDSASDRALGCGAELILHAYPDGNAPGRQRLEALRLSYKQVPAPGTSEDVAMLIAAERGAELIITVGAHFNLSELLDKNRHGMSSTFLTRLRVGEILVDAKGVSRLHKPPADKRPVLALTLAACVTLLVVIATSSNLGPLLGLLWLKLELLLGLK